MTIEKNKIIYELNDNTKTAKLIKCLSNDVTINIPSIIHDKDSNGNDMDFELESISDSAFKDCENLQTIKYGASSKIKYIGNNAFKNCISIEKITLPDGIDHISSGCFCNCLNLKEVTTNASIKRICASAFENCKSLNSIDNLITDNLLYINKNAFKDCKNLNITKQINSIKRIDRHAFENCQYAVITGQKLKYHNGAKFEAINNNIKKKWDVSNKILFAFTPWALLSVYMIINNYNKVLQSWNYSNLIIILLIFAGLLCLLFPIEIVAKHQKTFWCDPVKYLLISLLLLCIMSGVGLFCTPDKSLFNSVSIQKNKSTGYYDLNVSPSESNTPMNQRSIKKEEQYRSVSQTEYSEITEMQQLAIDCNDESLIKIDNLLRDINNVNKIELRYTKKERFLFIETDNSEIPLFIKYENGDLNEIKFNDQNTCELPLKNTKEFSILTNSDMQDSKIILLKFHLNKTTETTINIFFIIIFAVIAIAMIFFFFVAVVYAVSYLIKIQPLIEQNKVIISVLLIILSFVLSAFSLDNLSDIFFQFSSVTSQS